LRCGDFISGCSYLSWWDNH